MTEEGTSVVFYSMQDQTDITGCDKYHEDKQKYRQFCQMIDKCNNFGINDTLPMTLMWRPAGKFFNFVYKPGVYHCLLKGRKKCSICGTKRLAG
jgi:hypothetical protein